MPSATSARIAWAGAGYGGTKTVASPTAGDVAYTATVSSASLGITNRVITFNVDASVCCVGPCPANDADSGTTPPPNQLIDIVRNGIDRTRFRPRSRVDARRALGLPEGGPIVLYVGHLKRQKGALDLIRAFAHARDRLGDARLVMVGDGPDQAACRDLCAELGVNASLVGAQPHDQIPEWLAASDLLALPSWAEGLPNVVLEALASGRRVVASSVGGIPDVVDRPLFGQLVPPKQPATPGSLKPNA
jgi:glycosyltransferase involved in cell wall biosynthesis